MCVSEQVKQERPFSEFPPPCMWLSSAWPLLLAFWMPRPCVEMWGLAQMTPDPVSTETRGHTRLPRSGDDTVHLQPS